MTKDPFENGTTVEIESGALRKIPLFRRLNESNLQLLAFTSETRVYRPGETLIRQSEQSDEAYIILKGRVGVEVDTGTGPSEVAQLGKNELIGEIAVLCGTARSATVVAIEEVRVLRIDKSTFFRLMREFPEIAEEVMRVLALRLERTTRELAVLKAKS